MTKTRVLCLLAVSAGLGQAQLYVLTGSASESSAEQFGSAIFRVDPGGGVKAVAEAVPASIGSGWIDVSYDWRKAVLLQLARDNSVVVVDFDKAAVVKKCEAPVTRGTSWLYAWLADSPTLGATYNWLSAGGNGADPSRDTIIDEMVLDPAVPCKDSFRRLDPTNLRYITTHGRVGIDDVVSAYHGAFNIDRTGDRWVVSGFTTKAFPTQYEFPGALITGFTPIRCNVDVSDSKELALSLFDKVGTHKASHMVLVYRRSDRTWHRLPIASECAPQLRGFGRYIAVTETQERTASNKATVGASEWVRRKRTYGPNLMFYEEGWPVVYPGKLHLYDIETERVLSIETRQGDSEILLVDGGTVYYRVTNRLYSAPILDSAIGRATLLATDDAVLDAHWAWVKH